METQMHTHGVEGLIVLLCLVIVAVCLVPLIFYLLTLQRALSRCSVECRTLSPGLVWLLLIPLFSLVWHFIVVTRLAKSLHNEFANRNIVAEPTPGQGIGLAMCILAAASVIPYVGGLTGIAAFICWIIYWVKIANYSARLLEPAGQPAAPAR